MAYLADSACSSDLASAVEQAGLVGDNLLRGHTHIEVGQGGHTEAERVGI